MTGIQKIIVVVLAAALVLGAILANVLGVYQGFLDRFSLLAFRPVSLGLILAIMLANAGLLWVTIYAVLRFYKIQRLSSLEKALPPSFAPRESARREWEEIRMLANSSAPSEWNMAVLRADALAEQALRDAGYEGQTFADRLKIADPTVLKSLDQLWSAHRVRNIIAHEPLEQHSRESIITALRAYEQALKELGMLEEPSPPPAPTPAPVQEQKKPVS